MYATFALREEVGGRGEPYLCSWILQDDKEWHDVVRGDGGSYRSGGPDDLEMNPGESETEFSQRVDQYMSEWEARGKIS